MDFKGLRPNRGWNFLADLNREELKKMTLSIKDNTGLVLRGIDGRCVRKEIGVVETELRKLQFLDMEKKRALVGKWGKEGMEGLTGGGRNGSGSKGSFKPVLKAIQEIKGEWEYWEGIH